MQIDDAEVRVVQLLESDPVTDGAKVVAEVDRARGLDAGEDALAAGGGGVVRVSVEVVEAGLPSPPAAARTPARGAAGRERGRGKGRGRGTGEGRRWPAMAWQPRESTEGGRSSIESIQW